MTIRKYSSRAQQTTLSSGITAGDLTMTVGSGTNLMGGKTPTVTQTYTVVIDPDTALEEIVDVSNYSGTGNTLTIARGIDTSPSVGQAHSAGAIVRHMVIGRDLTDSNDHLNEVTTAHGLTIANVLVSATGLVTSAMITDGSIVNADVNASAAIAYGKLNLAGTITSSDLTNDTILDADINTAANIAWTKIAPSATVSAVELGYVDGVTSGIQAQIDAKLATTVAASTYAPIASPTLTGVPAAPTASGGTSTTQIATTAFVSTAVSNLVGGATAALDTLNELATALGNDANFATTTAASIAAKLPLAGGTMSGAIAMGTSKITGLGTPTVSTDAATKAYADSIVATSPSNLTGPITSVGAATSIASQTGTGTKFVVDTSPTLVTPVLGVATATSINATAIPSTKTLVVTTDNLTVLAATTSAQLAGVISDETGTGALVFANSPTLVTPALGTPSAINLTNATAVPTDATKANIASPTFTGTVTIPAGAVITAPKINLAFNAQTGTTYTLVAADSGKLVTSSNAASVVVTIPPSVYAEGEQINVASIGVGLTSFAQGAGVTITSTGAVATAPVLRARYSAATVICTASNTFLIVGDIS